MAQIWSCDKELRALQKTVDEIFFLKREEVQTEKPGHGKDSNPLLESIVMPALCDLI